MPKIENFGLPIGPVGTNSLNADAGYIYPVNSGSSYTVYINDTNQHKIPEGSIFIVVDTGGSAGTNPISFDSSNTVGSINGVGSGVGFQINTNGGAAIAVKEPQENWVVFNSR